METKRYFKLTGKEQSACRAICAIAPLYPDLVVDFDRFSDDPVYTKKIAALAVSFIGEDLRDTVLRAPAGLTGAGFGTLCWYLKKISVLL